MAVAILIEIPGVTIDQIEAQMAAMGTRENPPAGSILHLHGPTPDGVRVLEVWASQEAADAHYNSARFQQATQNPTTPPQITSWTFSQMSPGPALT